MVWQAVLFVCVSASLSVALTPSPTPKPTTTGGSSSHYVVKGNVDNTASFEDGAEDYYCQNDEDTKARYNTSVRQDGFVHNTIAVSCCFINSTGHVDGARPDCDAEPATYDDAYAICSSYGYRLCTLDEMVSKITLMAGCWYNFAYSWVSNGCNLSPTTNPSEAPSTTVPTRDPTTKPTSDPTRHPTTQPTIVPTVLPSNSPSGAPSLSPSSVPSSNPSSSPTTDPTLDPTADPTMIPTVAPGDKLTVSQLFPAYSATSQPTGATSQRTSASADSPQNESVTDDGSDGMWPFIFCIVAVFACGVSVGIICNNLKPHCRKDSGPLLEEHQYANSNSVVALSAKPQPPMVHTTSSDEVVHINCNQASEMSIHQLRAIEGIGMKTVDSTDALVLYEPRDEKEEELEEKGHGGHYVDESISVIYENHGEQTQTDRNATSDIITRTYTPHSRGSV